MRQLTDLIDWMVAHIPLEQTGLLGELGTIRRIAEFASPEQMYVHFTRTAEVLRGSFGDDPAVFTDWQVEVIRVWVDNRELTREQMVAMGSD